MSEDSKIKNNVLSEDQLAKVSGGMTEGEERVMEHYAAVKEQQQKVWDQEAERKKEEEEEQKRRYIENKQRMQAYWESQAH